MNKLNLEQLLQIHALLITQTGGSGGIRDLGRLESVIATQTQNVFGEELYLNHFDKAAALIRGIIADHPFVDGNKRTGMLAGLTYLAINKITFTGAAGLIEDFAVEVAISRLDVKVIAGWLEQNSKPQS